MGWASCSPLNGIFAKEATLAKFLAQAANIVEQ
jgi:hypothetical protein